MDVATFARYANQIDAEDSTTTKTQLLAEAFTDSGDNLAPATRFFQGQVFPQWDGRKVNMGPSLMQQAIAKAAGSDEDTVEQVAADVGDTGAAIESLGISDKAKQQILFDEDIALTDVYEKFADVAEMSGSGSQQRKIDAMADLFLKLEDTDISTDVASVDEDDEGDDAEQESLWEAVGSDNDSDDASDSGADSGSDTIAITAEEQAKYLIRLVLDEMRIGVGQGTIRDAIAETFDTDSDDVQRAIMVSADIGKTAETARDDGGDGLRDMTMTVGRPVEAMLAVTGDIDDSLEEWGSAVVEEKYDGARCVGPRTRIYTEKDGMKTIEGVEEGQRVLTHEGHYREVEAKMRRKFREKDEQLYNVSTWLGMDFEITGDHEVLTVTSEGHEWRPMKNVESGDEVAFPLPVDRHKTGALDDTLTLTTHAGYTKTVPQNADFFRFLGYWIGDGGNSAPDNGSFNTRITLVFNAEDRQLMEQYRDLCKNLFNLDDEVIHEHEHNGAVTLYWSDKCLMRWLSTHFRRDERKGHREKVIPDFLQKASRTQFEALYRGWYEADGTKGKQDIIGTKDPQLASELQLLGLQHGVVFGLSMQRINNSSYYYVERAKSETYASIVDDMVHAKILKRDRIASEDVHYRKPVYDLQVAGDSSYCTPIMALHNCQIQLGSDDDVHLFTRGLEDVTDSLPDVVDIVRQQVDAEEAILDSEVVAYNEDDEPMEFTKIMERLGRKHDIDEKQDEITVDVRVFDILYHNGDAVMLKGATDRFDIIQDIAEDLAAGHIESDDPKEIRDFEAKALNRGHEGIMLKRPDAPYSPGKRGQDWRKVKPEVETLDCVVIGGEWGEGKRSRVEHPETGEEVQTIGSYELGVLDDNGNLKSIGKVATGFTDAQLVEMTERFEDLIVDEDGKNVTFDNEEVFEVGYEELQPSPEYASGFGLRFPRFLGLRTDKRVEDADTIERVSNIHEKQN